MPDMYYTIIALIASTGQLKVKTLPATKGAISKNSHMSLYPSNTILAGDNSDNMRSCVNHSTFIVFWPLLLAQHTSQVSVSVLNLVSSPCYPCSQN